MKTSRWIVLMCSYIVAITCLIFYLLFAQNEYSWMREMNESTVLPVDDDMKLKAFLFGVPSELLFIFISYYSFVKFGLLVRAAGVFLLFAGTLLIMVYYPGWR